MSFINIEACFFYTGDSTLLDSDGLFLLTRSHIIREAVHTNGHSFPE